MSDLPGQTTVVLTLSPGSIHHRWKEAALGLTTLAAFTTATVAAAPINLGPEVNPDPSPQVTTAAAGNQRVPSGAFDGSQFFFVWQDGREEYRAIYGARITPQGTLLDPYGIVISRGRYFHEDPRVVFDGVNFIVAWADNRSGDFDVYATRVRPSDGVVLDPSGQLLAGGSGDEEAPALAFNGTHTLAVWQTSNGAPRDIRGVRIATGAIAPLGPSFDICSDPGEQNQPQVASPAGVFYVVWRDLRAQPGGEIFGTAVSPSGTVASTSGTRLVAGSSGAELSSPTVVANPSGFLAAWVLDDGAQWPAFGDFYAKRIGFDGGVIDTSPLSLFDGGGQDFSPNFAFDGTQYVMVWNRSRDLVPTTGYRIVSARFNANGQRLQTFETVVDDSSTYSYTPRIAYGSNGYLVAWEGAEASLADAGGENTLDLFYSRLDSNGVPTGPTRATLANSANAQTRVAAAFNGVSTLAAWEDMRVWPPTVVASLLDSALAPAGGPLIIAPRSDRVWAFYEGKPAAASDGTDFLLLWGDLAGPDPHNLTGYVMGARVSGQGQLLGVGGGAVPDGGFVVATGPGRRFRPQVIWDGQQYFAVWIDWRDGMADVFGARISRSGVVLDPGGIRIASSAQVKDRASVAFDGTRYLVVWSEGDTVTTDNVLGRFVDRGGTVQGAAPLTISSAQGRQFWPAVAFNRQQYLVVWHDHRNASHGTYGARVTPQGTVLDTQGMLLSQASDDLEVPAVAPLADTFLVAWPAAFAGDYELRGVRVLFDGGIVRERQAIALPDGGVTAADPGPYEVLADGGTELILGGLAGTHLHPSVTQHGNNAALVSYSRFIDSAGAAQVLADRARLRVLVETSTAADLTPDGSLTPDASNLPDGSLTDDGGPPDDAGNKRGARVLQVGCGCTASPWPVSAALGVLWLLRRRLERARG